jgi:hypothetical protein
MARFDSIIGAQGLTLSPLRQALTANYAFAGLGASFAARIAALRTRRAAPATTGRRTTQTTLWTVVWGALASLCCAVSSAQDNYRQQMKGLDEQVQEIKSDVLSIAQELNRLEERLLYPSNTQIALFIALADGDAVRLDAVQIQIDGQPVARYIYSHKELEALQKGGVQRVYTGNVPTGEHQLEVSVIGKLAGGRDYSETGRFNISKGVAPKLVGITLSGPESGKAAIEIGDW